MNDFDKEMKEAYEIALEHDQIGQWQKRYLGKNIILDKAMQAIDNTIENENLYKLMLSRNGLRNENISKQRTDSKNDRQN